MASPSPAPYQVLARKYRPQRFEDLIGQDAMVTTLTNAFKTGRIAHAFMLTGVRGVGKTTTARLLARALNYKTELVDAPSITLDPPGALCPSIAAGRHPDVLEMDAASRTGVNDIRDILDGVSYSPGEARFKIYIIDEVHMLSSSAFNALLKTLEEPPAHAKFIFATTEIRKVPVTVLSRCQRFDLKRVPPDLMTTHLAHIAQTEGASIAEDGLKLIARASEGSVRDGLSLLDQALVQGDGDDPASPPVDAQVVRDMLGLADRSATFDVFAAAVSGDGTGALAELDRQYAAGADPVVVFRDLLDHCHAVTRAKALGEAAVFTDASDHVARVRALADGAAMGHLSRVWQMLLKGHEETRTAPDPLAAAEMALLRVAHAAGLPSPEDAARALAGAHNGSTAGHTPSNTSGAGPTPASTAQMPTPQGTHQGAHQRAAAPPPPAASLTLVASGGAQQAAVAEAVADAFADPLPRDEPPPIDHDADVYGFPAHAGADAPPDYDDVPVPDAYDDGDTPPHAAPNAPAPDIIITSLDDVSKLAETKRDLLLKSQIDRGMRLVRLEPGKIIFSPTDHAPEDLSARLARALLDWTGARWLIASEPGGSQAETISERRKRENAEREAAVRADPTIKLILETWPDAEIVSIREPSEDDPTPP